MSLMLKATISSERSINLPKVTQMDSGEAGSLSTGPPLSQMLWASWMYSPSHLVWVLKWNILSKTTHFPRGKLLPKGGGSFNQHWKIQHFHSWIKQNTQRAGVCPDWQDQAGWVNSTQSSGSDNDARHPPWLCQSTESVFNSKLPSDVFNVL